MSLIPSNIYTIVDKDAHIIGELHAARSIENWYTAKIKNMQLTESLQNLLGEIDRYVKVKEFSIVRQLEAQLQDHGLHIQETNHHLNEIQIDKKGKIFFKLAEQ